MITLLMVKVNKAAINFVVAEPGSSAALLFAVAAVGLVMFRRHLVAGAETARITAAHVRAGIQHLNAQPMEDS